MWRLECGTPGSSMAQTSKCVITESSSSSASWSYSSARYPFIHSFSYWVNSND